jgi:hypothetical protein
VWKLHLYHGNIKKTNNVIYTNKLFNLQETRCTFYFGLVLTIFIVKMTFFIFVVETQSVEINISSDNFLHFYL